MAKQFKGLTVYKVLVKNSETKGSIEQAQEKWCEGSACGIYI